MQNLDAAPKKMTYLLDQIEARDLALPDFQRSFVWQAPAVRELLVSIFSNYPAGSILLLRDGATSFTPRAVETAPELDGRTPTYLALDGQQRLTSLYQASRGTASHVFYVNVADLLSDLRRDGLQSDAVGYDLDEAIESYPRSRTARWRTIDGQAESLMLPLDQVTKWSDWKDAVVAHHGAEETFGPDLSKHLNRIHRDVVRRFDDYFFAVTTLESGTPLDAVCSIFETINRTGVKLNVFELLTARSYARGENLREKWAASRDEYQVLVDFEVDPYYLLQVVALRVGKGVKRSDILSLTPDQLADNWSTAAAGMAGALNLLRANCGVYNAAGLPYMAAATVLAGVWDVVDGTAGPARGRLRERVKRWFWCVCLSATFDTAANTRTQQEYAALRAWLRDGAAPEAVAGFDASRDLEAWRKVTPRQRAQYRTAMALFLSNSPLDFHTAQVLTSQLILSEAIDDHHVFPRNWLATALPKGHESVDCVLNRTLIDRTTNIAIRDKAPSDYLAEMAEAMGDVKLGEVLTSHRLDANALVQLRADRFEDFLRSRESRLQQLIAAATGG